VRAKAEDNCANLPETGIGFWKRIVWETLSPFVWLLVGCLLVWMAIVVVDYISHPTFPKLEQAIKRELPVGTPWQGVQAFLDRKQFRHSESLGLLPSDKASILINPGCDKLKGKEDRLEYRISGYSRVANWRPELFCGCGRVHVEFYFDEQGKLVDYVAYEFGDAP
jgi:hypothetical protein